MVSPPPKNLNSKGFRASPKSAQSHNNLKATQKIKESKSQRVPSSPRLRTGKARNCKETKDLRFRLAETEHELVDRMPLEVGLRPTVDQPQTAAAASQLEDVRVAVGVGDLLHAHVNPLI